MVEIYLDESGYTGDDLLDAAQPVFTLATHALSEGECKLLRDAHFGRLQVDELKHANLQRRGANQRLLVEFVKALVPYADRIKLGLAHKKYALTLKLIDLGVEPHLHRAGFDIYRTDFFKTFGNLVYFVLQAGELDTLGRILPKFQSLVRRRSQEALVELGRSVQLRTGIDAHDSVLDDLEAALSGLRFTDITSLPPAALDLSLTGAIQLMHEWRSSGFSEISIIHDRSSNMAKQKLLWDAVVSPEAPRAIVGYGDKPVEFPIGVVSTSFVDSKTSSAIQIADLLSGALARWAKWFANGRPDGDTYAAALDPVFNGFCLPSFAWIVWPVPQFTPEQTSSDMGDYLEYVTSRFAAASKASHGVESS
jgi:Protein of unknown function (DUF3800)